MESTFVCSFVCVVTFRLRSHFENVKLGRGSDDDFIHQIRSELSERVGSQLATMHPLINLGMCVYAGWKTDLIIHSESAARIGSAGPKKALNYSSSLEGGVGGGTSCII